MDYYGSIGFSTPRDTFGACDTVRHRRTGFNTVSSSSGFTVSVQDNVVSVIGSYISEARKGLFNGINLVVSGVTYCPKKLCEWAVTVAQTAKHILSSSPSALKHEGHVAAPQKDDCAEVDQKPDADGYTLKDFKRDEMCGYKLGTKAKRIDDTLLLETFITINRMSQYQLDHNPRGLPSPSLPIEASFEQLLKWVVTAQERSYSDETVAQINDMIKQWQKTLPGSTKIKLLPLARQPELSQPVVPPPAQKVQPMKNHQPVYVPPVRQYYEPPYLMQPQQAQPQYVRPYGMQPQPQIQQQYEHPRPIQPQNVYPVQEHQQPSRKECWNHLPEPQYHGFKEARFPTHLQDDPYLVCPQLFCKRQFKESQLPEYRHHIDVCVNHMQPTKHQEVYISDGINSEIRRVAEEQRNKAKVECFVDGLALDPYLICHKCKHQFQEGQFPEYRHHIDNCRA